MSNIEDAYFAVQRGNEVFNCIGSELADKLKEGDVMAVHRPANNKTYAWEIETDKLPWDDESKATWHITNLSKVASPESDTLSDLYVMLTYSTQMEVYQIDGANPTKNLADLNNVDDPESLIIKADGSNLGVDEQAEIQELIAEIQAIAPDYPDFIPLVRIPTGGEYVIVHEQNNPVVDGEQLSEHPVFLSDNMSWDFGDLTRTNLVTKLDYLTIGAWEFNGDVGKLDMSNVTSIYRSLGLKFNHPSIGLWDTGNVERVGNLFESNNVFNQDISGWDMRKVRSVSFMFASATSFNQDISGWEFRDITQSGFGDGSMNGMFYNASSFNQDLSGWCVSNVPPTPSGFDTLSGFEGQTDRQPQWGTCP